MMLHNLLKQYADEAKAYAQQFGIPTGPGFGQNDDFDAFRHAYSSAAMTQDYGSAFADFADQLNELNGDIFHSQPSSEKNMESLEPTRMTAWNLNSSSHSTRIAVTRLMHLPSTSEPYLKYEFSLCQLRKSRKCFS